MKTQFIDKIKYDFKGHIRPHHLYAKTILACTFVYGSILIKDIRIGNVSNLIFKRRHINLVIVSNTKIV